MVLAARSTSPALPPPTLVSCQCGRPASGQRYGGQTGLGSPEAPTNDSASTHARLGIRFSVGCALIIQMIVLWPSGAIWTDEASNVRRLDPSGAVQADAEHPNRKVESSILCVRSHFITCGRQCVAWLGKTGRARVGRPWQARFQISPADRSWQDRAGDVCRRPRSATSASPTSWWPWSSLPLSLVASAPQPLSSPGSTRGQGTATQRIPTRRSRRGGGSRLEPPPWQCRGSYRPRRLR
jgi:hypothetical protein